jgi:hypothetical protein
MAPVTVPWSDLGVTGLEEPPLPEPGPRVFARLSETKQRQILGPAKFEAYRAGEVRIEDFVVTRFSPTWGRSTSEGSLRAARQRAARRA